MMTGVKTLLDGEFDQALSDDSAFFNVIDPEIPALACVFGDCFAVLAGDGDLHDFFLGLFRDWLSVECRFADEVLNTYQYLCQPAQSEFSHANQLDGR